MQSVPKPEPEPELSWPASVAAQLDRLVPTWGATYVGLTLRGVVDRLIGPGIAPWDRVMEWKRQWPTDDQEPPGSFRRYYVGSDDISPVLPGLIAEAAKGDPAVVDATVGVLCEVMDVCVTQYPETAERAAGLAAWFRRFAELCHTRAEPFPNRDEAQAAFVELADEETAAQFPEVTVPRDWIAGSVLRALQGLQAEVERVRNRPIRPPEFDRLVAEAVLPVCIALQVAGIETGNIPSTVLDALALVDAQVQVTELVEQTLAGEETALSASWTAWKAEQRFVPPTSTFLDIVAVRSDDAYRYMTMQLKTADAVLAACGVKEVLPVVKALGAMHHSAPRVGNRLVGAIPEIQVPVGTTAESSELVVASLDDITKEIERANALGGLKLHLQEVASLLRGARARKDAELPLPALPWQFFLVGDIGAGARDAAHFLGRLYDAANLIERADVVACTPDEFIDPGSAGSTRDFVDALVSRAEGGVLFIESVGGILDVKSEYGKVAVRHLAARLEELQHTVVILNDTKARLDDVVTTEPRYGRRLSERWVLDDPTPDELQAAFEQKIQDASYSCSPEALALARSMMTRLAQQPATRNLSAAHRVFQHATRCQSERVGAMDVPTAEDLRTLTLDDFDPGALGLPDVETLADVLAELDGLIGLDELKADIRAIADTAEVAVKRKQAGLAVPPITRHLVFLGSPGTGKTTIARLLAAIYREQGLLRIGHLVEASRGELVAEYLGQTAPKTQRVFESALGGVLFIDEAHALRTKHYDSFGDEAVATLVRLMEDHRDDIVVIVAGYPKEMARFLESNLGLASRFRRTLEFPDYTNDELLAIIEGMVEKSDYVLTPAARKQVVEVLAGIERDEAFGNGRFARQLFEQTLTRQAQRIVKLADPDTAALRTILPEDVTELDPRDAAKSKLSTGQYL